MWLYANRYLLFAFISNIFPIAFILMLTLMFNIAPYTNFIHWLDNSKLLLYIVIFTFLIGELLAIFFLILSCKSMTLSQPFAFIIGWVVRGLILISAVYFIHGYGELLFHYL